MFRKVFGRVKGYQLKFGNPGNSTRGMGNGSTSYKTADKIPGSIDDLKGLLEAAFEGSSDFIIREISLGKEPVRSVIIVFIDGLVNMQLINSDILRPLMTDPDASGTKGEPSLELLKKRIITSCEIGDILDIQQALDAILSGDVVLFLENEKTALKVNMRDWEKRNIEEPQSDAVIRGPREGFTETLHTNMSLLRRIIKNSSLRFEKMKVGEQTNTDICICYIKGIADEQVVKSIRKRISRIETAAVLESGYIEEYIEEYPYSIFPTVGNSEKPDIIAGKILEGRVAILCDGSPFVLTVPYLFVEAIQASEDYYTKFIYTLPMRFVRILALFITLMLPAFYVALVCFHQDVIPYKLLLTMAASKEGIPFPPLLEALMMVITFELLREAGIRMPRAIGQAVSIVGALVIGDSAVKAGLISTPMVIIISLTAITSFIVNKLSYALLIIRIILMLAANVIGIYGIMLVFIVLVIRLCSLKPFGVDYMTPFIPLNMIGLRDTFMRFPLKAMFLRPKELAPDFSEESRLRSNMKKGANKV